MGAGGGYSTELLARRGRAGGTDTRRMPQGGVAESQGSASTSVRSACDCGTSYASCENYDDPVPSWVRDLDLITFFFAYHDTAFMTPNRGEDERGAVRGAKPGGVLVIADHSAHGRRRKRRESLHRIEEAMLRQEISRGGGFRLVGERDFLRSGGSLGLDRISSKVR